MDMMDVYVDDYSKPDPLPDSWLEKLEQVSRLGDRAGRDREEAERRKALAEAEQAAGRRPRPRRPRRRPRRPPMLSRRRRRSPGPTYPPRQDQIPTLPLGESGT